MSLFAIVEIKTQARDKQKNCWHLKNEKEKEITKLPFFDKPKCCYEIQIKYRVWGDGGGGGGNFSDWIYCEGAQ